MDLDSVPKWTRIGCRSPWGMGSKAREAVSALTAALNDRDAEVRLNAAGALGDLGPEAKAVVPALRALLKDKKRNVRETAAQPLKTIEGKE